MAATAICFNRDPHFQRVMVARVRRGGCRACRGFNRDPHFQRVMVHEAREKEGFGHEHCFNRDPHFQRVMGDHLPDFGHPLWGFNRDPHFQRVMESEL